MGTMPEGWITMSARITASNALELMSAKMDAQSAKFDALTAAIMALAGQSVAPTAVQHVPAQAPAIPVAEKYVPDTPKAATIVTPKHDAKAVIPSVAAWQHDGVLWIAFPAMGNCADEANVLFDALKSEPWFVNFDKSGNASAKKSVRVLPYIADKGLAAKYAGHSASIGSFDRAPKLADVAKRVKQLFVDNRDYFATVKTETAKPVKAAPVASNEPVFA
jgi:hypothetical protein